MPSSYTVTGGHTVMAVNQKSRPFIVTLDEPSDGGATVTVEAIVESANAPLIYVDDNEDPEPSAIVELFFEDGQQTRSFRIEPIDSNPLITNQIAFVNDFSASNPATITYTVIDGSDGVTVLDADIDGGIGRPHRAGSEYSATYDIEGDFTPTHVRFEGEQKVFVVSDGVGASSFAVSVPDETGIYKVFLSNNADVHLQIDRFAVVATGVERITVAGTAFSASGEVNPDAEVHFLLKELPDGAAGAFTRDVIDVEANASGEWEADLIAGAVYAARVGNGSTETIISIPEADDDAVVNGVWTLSRPVIGQQPAF